jgi:hypothetical protein
MGFAHISLFLKQDKQARDNVNQRLATQMDPDARDESSVWGGQAMRLERA